MIDRTLNWKDITWVAFDTETSGQYPVSSEIVELGAVKWRGGEIIAEFETLLKPHVAMGDEVIKIHGITNEMVADAPSMSEKIHEFREFIQDSILLAHHAPFDLGFMNYEFEKHGILAPIEPVVCTSLLSRRIIPESSNHKLVTLREFLKLPHTQAHRAKDDATACLQVAVKCFERMGINSDLESILNAVGKDLRWNYYSLRKSHNQNLIRVTEAIEKNQDLEIIYQGSKPNGAKRTVTPKGIVRSPDGDYMVAICHRDQVQKRFYFNKLQEVG